MVCVVSVSVSYSQTLNADRHCCVKWIPLRVRFVAPDATPASKLSRAAATVVTALMGQFAAVSCLQHIPLLVHFYQWLHTTFAHRVTQEEAIDLTVRAAIETRLDPADRVSHRGHLWRRGCC